jgi:hypothetical protein
MRDYASQAAQALAVYVERGRKALAAIEAGELDEAERLLRLRGAAFHNFRALDDLALKAGIDLGGDERLAALAAADAERRGPLEKALRAVYAKTGRQLAKIREARQTLGNYRSDKQATPGSRFESSV